MRKMRTMPIDAGRDIQVKLFYNIHSREYSPAEYPPDFAYSANHGSFSRLAPTNCLNHTRSVLINISCVAPAPLYTSA